MPGPWLSSFPSGWPGEPRDKKARPRLSESLGCGQHWLSAQLVWLQPLPRLRHARSLGIALQPPAGKEGTSTWWVGVGLLPPSGQHSPSIPGTESSKAFLILVGH